MYTHVHTHVRTHTCTCHRMCCNFSFSGIKEAVKVFVNKVSSRECDIGSLHARTCACAHMVSHNHVPTQIPPHTHAYKFSVKLSLCMHVHTCRTFLHMFTHILFICLHPDACTCAEGWDGESPLPMCEDLAAAFQEKLVGHIVMRTHRAILYLRAQAQRQQPPITSLVSPSPSPLGTYEHACMHTHTQTGCVRGRGQQPLPAL